MTLTWSAAAAAKKRPCAAAATVRDDIGWRAAARGAAKDLCAPRRTGARTRARVAHDMTACIVCRKRRDVQTRERETRFSTRDWLRGDDVATTPT